MLGGRQKEQKFGILDAPRMVDMDLARGFGPLGAALIYLDIDNFKEQNAQFAETVVDKTLLPDFQRLIALALGTLGYAYREGGDEIILYLPNASVEMGVATALAMRQAIEEHVFAVQEEEVKLTASFGVAGARDAAEADQLRLSANQAKAHAKKCGRNRVAVALAGERMMIVPEDFLESLEAARSSNCNAG